MCLGLNATIEGEERDASNEYVSGDNLADPDTSIIQAAHPSCSNSIVTFNRIFRKLMG